ncbi:hypothetical protein BU52_01480 [Streptomyces toyocaensis]|uniref:Uncharacterized protein n=1 Tax=Streptomyces toyocaensis TaxID=55952 RepID=A0A081XYX5_STRTO|nr:hypothetical protein BU52_01480 [Streptomyces toyocaensis]
MKTDGGERLVDGIQRSRELVRMGVLPKDQGIEGVQQFSGTGLFEHVREIAISAVFPAQSLDALGEFRRLRIVFGGRGVIGHEPRLPTEASNGITAEQRGS